MAMGDVQPASRSGVASPSLQDWAGIVRRKSSASSRPTAHPKSLCPAAGKPTQHIFEHVPSMLGLEPGTDNGIAVQISAGPAEKTFRFEIMPSCRHVAIGATATTSAHKAT